MDTMKIKISISNKIHLILYCKNGINLNHRTFFKFPVTCTEQNEVLVESMACERTCQTRNYTNEECSENMIKHADSCTCAEDYVRYNGTCIHKDECPCYDEEGNVRR